MHKTYYFHFSDERTTYFFTGEARSCDWVNTDVAYLFEDGWCWIRSVWSLKKFFFLEIFRRNIRIIRTGVPFWPFSPWWTVPIRPEGKKRKSHSNSNCFDSYLEDLVHHDHLLDPTNIPCIIQFWVHIPSLTSRPGKPTEPGAPGIPGAPGGPYIIN